MTDCRSPEAIALGVVRPVYLLVNLVRWCDFSAVRPHDNHLRCPKPDRPWRSTTALSGAVVADNAGAQLARYTDTTLYRLSVCGLQCLKKTTASHLNCSYCWITSLPESRQVNYREECRAFSCLLVAPSLGNNSWLNLTVNG